MASIDSLTASFYDNEQYSDIIIKFGEHQIRAHKVILAQQSGYFMTAFSSRFQVASNPIIDLGEDDDPEILTEVIMYLYRHGPIHDHLSDFDGLSQCSVSLNRLIDVYLLADKYDIYGLRCKVIWTFYCSAVNDLKKLQASATFNSVFVDCIAEICGPSSPELADRTLYDTVIGLCKEFLSTLFRSEIFVQRYSKGELFDNEQAAAFGLELGKSVLMSRGILPVVVDKFCKPRYSFDNMDLEAKARNTHNFYKDKRFSDITLTFACYGTSLSAHRIVLATQSCYFNELLKNDRNLAEIIFEDDNYDAPVATTFLEDMYMPFSSPSNARDWPLHFAEMYMLAKKHGRDDAASYYEDCCYDAMSDCSFDDEYLGHVAAFCGPSSTRYADTPFAEMAFQHILYRIERFKETKKPPYALQQGW
ncbi:hypothetical protein KCU78_g17455, partial [Aureobasidium melanogenum]